LTDALAGALDLPALHKDDLVHGRWRTLGRGLDLGESGVEPFFRSMELWAACGVSFVAEQTFYRGRSEPDVARRLAPRCRLLHVHCRSERSFDRWRTRMLNDPLCGEARLRALEPRVKRLENELLQPLDFGCPVFVVNTDDGYRPTLGAVVGAIDSLYSRPRTHELDGSSPDGELSRAESLPFTEPLHDRRSYERSVLAGDLGLTSFRSD
jgi:hypothetical protein